MGAISLITPEPRRLEGRLEQAVGLFRFAGLHPFEGIGGLCDWRLLGRLSRLAIEGFLTGDEGERLLFPLGGRLPQAVLLVIGLGPRDGFGRPRFRSALERLFAALDGLRIAGVALALPGRVEEACDVAAAIDWFGEAYTEHGRDRDVAIIERASAHKVLLPALERWRLKRSLSPGL
jgi:hypothetical protein